MWEGLYTRQRNVWIPLKVLRARPCGQRHQILMTRNLSILCEATNKGGLKNQQPPDQVNGRSHYKGKHGLKNDPAAQNMLFILFSPCQLPLSPWGDPISAAHCKGHLRTFQLQECQMVCEGRVQIMIICCLQTLSNVPIQNLWVFLLKHLLTLVYDPLLFSDAKAANWSLLFSTIFWGAIEHPIWLGAQRITNKAITKNQSTYFFNLSHSSDNMYLRGGNDWPMMIHHYRPLPAALWV